MAHSLNAYLLTTLIALGGSQALGGSALHRAAEDGRVDLVKKLLKQSQAINARDATGCTPLMLALAGRDAPSDAEGDYVRRSDRPKERLEIVRLLLKKGARADIGGNAGCMQGASTTGVTPLMRAIELGRLDMLQAMLQQRVKPPLNLEKRDAEGKCALQYAAEEKTGQAVKQLVRAGAKVNARGPYGMTALMTAAYADAFAPASELLKAGADPNAKSTDGGTALHGTSSPAITKLLLAHGARIALNRAGFSAYTLALWRRQKDLAAELERRNPPTGFIDAVLKSDLAGVKQWLTRGASANAKFLNETPILHSAVQQSSAEVVKALLDAGAKIEAKDIFLERTAILAALVENYDEPKTQEEEARRYAVVKVLVDAGANVLVRDSRSGFSPVMYAAKRNSLPLVKFFLSKGAVATEEDLEKLRLLHPDTSKEVLEALKAGR